MFPRFSYKIIIFYSVCAFIFIISLIIVQFRNLTINRTVNNPPKQTEKNINPVPNSADVTLYAVGDIMLSRTVSQKIAQNSPDYPFQFVTDFLHTGDINFANLENPITNGPVVPIDSMTFHATPGSEQGIKDAGFTVLCLANNHIPNYGAKGIADTIQGLDALGLKHTGAGNNLTEASTPAIMDVKGIRFAFLAYNDTDVIPPSYAAKDNPPHPGTNVFNIPLMQKSVQNARSALNADVVIVAMHAGHEYHSQPDTDQVDFAHAAIDAGADMVIGGHPHVLQPIEKYKDKYIFYSLGNFVFDQQFEDDVQQSVITETHFIKNAQSGEVAITVPIFHPAYLKTLAQPKLIQESDPEYAAIISRLTAAVVPEK